MNSPTLAYDVSADGLAAVALHLMYDIKQFKPTLYVLVICGITGFALAARSPAIWLLGASGVLLNGWLVARGKFRPLPRWAANLITVAALLYVARQLFSGQLNAAVLVIGQFLVALQLVKLWEQRGNRDYAQLLVLSLLLMVAASINTASLTFGVVLAGYLFLSLYCCLLFHLKVETDAAKAAMPLPEEKIPPARLRQDQRHLSRSMRRLTAIVSFASLSMAVLVFLFFPRGAGQNVLAGMQMAQGQTLTGFSEEVSLTDVTSISQNDAVVAHVEVWKSDEKVAGSMPLLLRGLTLDTYAREEGGGRWIRSRREAPEQAGFKDSPTQFESGLQGPWRQKVLLHPTGTRTIFALASPSSITFRRDMRFKRDLDGVLQTVEAPNSALEYEVFSSGVLPSPGVDRGGLSAQRAISPKIWDYALDPAITGANEKGPLAAQRLARGSPGGEGRPVQPLIGVATITRPDPLDAEIAASIERYLKGPNFAYTLNIGPARNRAGQDPYVWFLSPDGRRGHCEYFAGAMALLCQSLGINARVVVGFRCDEYNSTPGAGYYIVRQSHAHAWVEVLTSEGWKTYDPTSGRDDSANRRGDGWVNSFKHFLDFLEYTYATNVIAYDNDNRENLIQAVESRMTNQVYRGINSTSYGYRLNVKEMVASVTRSLASILITVIALVGFGMAGRILWQKFTLRRRAARIGIEALPADEQMRLARQLGFYDALVQSLARRQIVRAPHQTPLEFARSLLFLPTDLYETVTRLTDVFYKIRFGRVELSAARQRNLANVVTRLDQRLTEATPQ